MPEVYRADHVGSLLRPPEVKEARAAFQAGNLTSGRLQEIEDRAILRALDRQRSVGVDIYTDGEFRRGVFTSDMAEAVEGFVATEQSVGAMIWHGPRRRTPESGEPAGGWCKATAATASNRFPGSFRQGARARSGQDYRTQPQLFPDQRLPTRHHRPVLSDTNRPAVGVRIDHQG